ncbi:HTH_Tnp_Tc3_2 domain-containing protein [Trichonephila clavipes]|nr:HTH_Tnp_Tc3_2 domain-containing protein [Trichonephila clavipes]
MADKDILEFVRSSKNIIDADSKDENEMNNAAPVTTSSEMRNIIKGNHQRARIVRHNDENVREGCIRNGGKEVKLFTRALKAFQCNNRIVMAQRMHLDDFLLGGIIGRLECGRTPSWKYPRNLESPRVSSPGFGNDSKMMVIRLGHIGLYARRPVRCVLLTATYCRLGLTWSREHALWTPQQWSCVMFSPTSPGLVCSLILAGH